MPLVLVTGATGYIAAHVCAAFLRTGTDVRGTVRSEDKGKELAATLEELGGKGRFEYVVVGDMQAEGCYDEAVKGIHGFIHVASPFFTENVTDATAQLISPAIKGTRNALLAAAKEPSCRRVVVTSSFASIVSTKPAGYVFSEKDWNEESRATGGTGQESYRASKVLAEKAAWEFVADGKQHFDVATMCPPLVVGPAIHPVSLETLNTSLLGVWRRLSGQVKEVPAGGIGYVDVRDLAEAHVKAFEVKEAGGKRFLVGEGFHTFQEEFDVLRRLYPQLDGVMPKGNPGPPYTHALELDNTQTKEVLGIKFKSFEGMIKDSAEQLMAMAEKEGVKIGQKA